jgi:hypothetical protein
MEPHISRVTKQACAEKIEAKLKVLRQWKAEGIPWKTSDAGELLRDADGECLLEFFPDSIASFCDWDGSQNTGLARSSISTVCFTNRSTLYRSHEAALSEIDSVCKALAKQAQKQIKEANKTKVIGELHTEVIYLRKLVSTQETEITEAAINNGRTETELLRIKRALVHLRERYDEETQQQRTRIAELTATLQKLAPLRKEE